MRRIITQLVLVVGLTLLGINAKADNVKFSDLNIIGTKEVTIEEEISTSQIYQTTTLDIHDAIVALGKTDADASENNKDIFYFNQYDSATEGKTDELTNICPSEDMVWWMSEVYDDKAGEETGDCVSQAYNSETSKMYLQLSTTTDGALNLAIGQAAGALVANKTYYTKIYLCFPGSKDAYEITVKLQTKEATLKKLSDFTKAGETNAELEIFYNSAYKYKTVELNTTEIKAQLLNLIDGSSIYGDDDVLTMYVLAEDSILSNNSTANRGGFWLDKNGNICSWGADSCALFCEPEIEGDLSKLHVGIYPHGFLINNTYNATIYILGNNESYHQLNITMNVLPTPTVAQCETMDTIKVTMEIIPDKSAAQDDTKITLTQDDYMKEAIDLNIEKITSLLGTDNPDFYTKSVNPTTGALLMYTNAHSTTIDSPQGFLMMDLQFFKNEAMYHTAAPFNPLAILTKAYGIGYENGKLIFWQQTGDREVGDYYQNEFYLVNTDAASKIAIELNVVFVEETAPKVEIVGTTDITLPKANAEGTDYAATDYEMTDILAALDCEKSEDATWRAYNFLGQRLTEGYDEMYGFSLDSDGKIAQADTTKALTVGYFDGQFRTYVEKDVAGKDFQTTILMENVGKAWQFNITLSDKEETIAEDVSGDGSVDSQDVLKVYDYMKNATANPTSTTKEDINKDGFVDSQDVLKIYDYMKQH